MEHKTLTGYDHCKNCQEKLDNNYIAFVEVSNDPVNGEHTITNENADRTGVIAWIKQHICDEVFNVKITTPMVFVQPDVVKYMQSLIPIE